MQSVRMNKSAIEISKAGQENHIYNYSVNYKSVQTRTAMWSTCKLTTKQQQSNYAIQLVHTLHSESQLYVMLKEITLKNIRKCE